MHPIVGRLGRTVVVAAMLGAAVFGGGSGKALASSATQAFDCINVPPLALTLSPMSGPAGSTVIVSATWPLGCAGDAVIKFKDSAGHIKLMERFHIPKASGGFARAETIPVHAAPGLGTVKAAVHYEACNQIGCQDAIAKGSERFLVR